MTPFAYFAFLAPPGILLILGYVAVRLQERAARQDEKQAHADRQGSPHLTA